MSKKITTTVYFEQYHVEFLREASKATRIPQAQLVREGLDYIVRKYQDVVENEDVHIDVPKVLLRKRLDNY